MNTGDLLVGSDGGVFILLGIDGWYECCLTTLYLYCGRFIECKRCKHDYHDNAHPDVIIRRPER